MRDTMIRVTSVACVLLAAAQDPATPRAQDRAAGDTAFPEAQISNGQIRAKLYLPDARRGFYRSTRFDWSGVIASLEYQRPSVLRAVVHRRRSLGA